MSNTCVQSASIVVAANSSLLAYYNFQSISGGLFLDTIGSSNITANDGGGLPTIVSGFIGNGIQCLVATNATESKATNWLLTELTSHDQTYRYWFRVNTDVHSELFIISPFVEIDTYLLVAGTLNVDVYITGTPTQSQQHFFNTVPGFDDTRYHSMAITIDYSGQVAKVYLDNVLIFTLVITLTQPYLVPKNNVTAKAFFIYMEASAAGRITLLDELGVWNKVLSAAELTVDYNGGAGRTYP